MNSWLIAGAVLRRMLREKSTLGFILVVPMLVSIMLVSLNPGGSPVKPVIGVANTDLGPAGAKLVDYLQEEYKVQVSTEARLADAVVTGKVGIGLVIPVGFTSSLALDTPERIAVQERAVTAAGEEFRAELEGILLHLREAARLDMEAGASGRGDTYLAEARPGKVAVTIAENRPPDASFTGQLGLGFLIMVLMLYGATLTGAILEDKRGKIFLRVFSAPVHEYELVLGNLLAYYALGLLQIAVSLLVISGLFRVDWGTPVQNVFLILSVYQVTSLGLSIGLSGLTGNQEKFMAINSLLVSPTCLLGGCFIPLSVMPAGMQLAANLVPQKWAMDAWQRLNQGAGLGDVATNLLILLLFGLVFFTFGVRTLKPGAES